jgi:hypothetical protein
MQRKRPGGRKEAVTDKDLYSAILSVLQSHFDSTEMPRSASQAVLAHQVGQDAINDWLSAKLTPQRLQFAGMMPD